MYRWYQCGFIAVTLGLIGCSSHPLADPWPEPRPLGAELTTSRPPGYLDRKDSAPESSIPDPSGELTLRQALALGLTRSSSLEIGIEKGPTSAPNWYPPGG